MPTAWCALCGRTPEKYGVSVKAVRKLRLDFLRSGHPRWHRAPARAEDNPLETLLSETLIRIADVAELLPPPSRPTYRTILRWTRHGVAGTRLEAIRLGGEVYTSREAFKRFLTRI